MLKFFSRLERTRNFVLLVFAILMVVSLIVFYAPARNDVPSNLTYDQTTAAKVGTEKITVSELAVQKDNMSRMGRPMPAKFFLDGMIRERIVRAEANRLNLTATDAEVASYIRQQQKNTPGQPFNQKIYEQNVTDQFGSVKAFEQSVRDELSGKKVEAFVTSGVTVPEEEVLDEFKRKNTKFDLSFVPVTSADIAQTIKPTDEELKNYFEQNRKNYYIGVPQKKIRYIYLDTSKIGEKLNITDEDLKAEFEKIPADKKQAGVLGQQIVLRVANPAVESQVLGKANNIIRDLKKDGVKVSEEAFAQVAKGQSEDIKTAVNGGKLPGLIKENANNPGDPYQQLLNMQPGDVSQPVKYLDKYYILRRGDAVQKTLEDTKKELEISLRNRRAYTVAAELANKIANRLKEVKDVQKVAEEFAAEARMNSNEMIRETGYVKPGDEVPNVGISPQFEEGIAALENQSDVGDKIPVKGGFAVPMLVEKREPREAEFDEVKNQVAESYKVEQAGNKIEEIAKQIAEGTANASNLSSVAQSKGLKAQDAKSFILGSPLGQGPNATTSQALEDAIYALKTGEVTKKPVKISDTWYVVAANNREEANMDDFAKQRDELVETKLKEKRGQVFSDYLASIKRELEDKKEITIYREALEKLDAADVPVGNE